MKADIRRIFDKLDRLFSEKQYAEAERLLRYWEKEARDEDDDRVQFAMVNEQMGLYRKLGREQEAMEAVSKMLAIIDEQKKRMTVDGCTALVNAATVYQAFGRSEEALSIFEDAAFIYEELLPKTDKRLASLYNNMSSTLSALKRFDEALELCEKALDILSQSEGNEPEKAITYLNMTGMYEGRDSMEEGGTAIEQCLEKAKECLEKAVSLQNGYLAFVYEKCAPTFGYYGYFAYKNELLKRAEVIYERLGAVT